MTEVSSSEYLLLHALADGELDAAAAMSLEARLAADPVLAAEYARILAVKERTKALGKPTVSPDFAARIAAITSDAKSTSARPQARILSFDHPSWRALAASVVLTAFAASGGTYLLSSAPHYDFSVEDQVANDHHRSLLATSPIDVVSTDRHTVKPWLDQKLGMSPPTADLSAAGFPACRRPCRCRRGRRCPDTRLWAPEAFDFGCCDPAQGRRDAKRRAGFQDGRWLQHGRLDGERF